MHYLKPFRFKYFKKLYKQNITILDVGCGNNSAIITKKYFKNCSYHGIDRENYNSSSHNIHLIDKFYQIDLEKESLSIINDSSYDLIIISHVIEHLNNGLEIIKELTKKLRKDGYIYIEYPSEKSLSLPSAQGSLHFCDDNTHKRLYHLIDIANVLLNSNCKIITAKKRRSLLRIAISPIALIISSLHFLVKGKIHSMGLWDLFGFAEFIIAKKTKD